MQKLLKSVDNNLTFIEIRAAGSILHDFYCGIEKIFEKIALILDNKIPEGENWHSELLLQMARPLEKRRNKVITEELFQELKEYLRFRHLFRHIYGFELKWEKFKDLCINLENIFNDFKKVLKF
ncbi:MAG: hypothetical protein ACTSQ8_10695 [Candidatus Helarchaeota archaeon]